MKDFKALVSEIVTLDESLCEADVIRLCRKSVKNRLDLYPTESLLIEVAQRLKNSILQTMEDDRIEGIYGVRP